MYHLNLRRCLTHAPPGRSTSWSSVWKARFPGVPVVRQPLAPMVLTELHWLPVHFQYWVSLCRHPCRKLSSAATITQRVVICFTLLTGASHARAGGEFGCVLIHCPGNARYGILCQDTDEPFLAAQVPARQENTHAEEGESICSNRWYRRESCSRGLPRSP